MGFHHELDTDLLYSFCSQPFSFQQLTEQIQNLTVSSTTSNRSNQATTSTSNKSTANSTDKNLNNSTKETTAASNDTSAKENLEQRVNFLQTKLASAPMPSITSKKRQLPSIEEAWNLPISAEMSSRQQQTAQGNQQRAYTKGLSHVSSDQMVCIFTLCI